MSASGDNCSECRAREERLTCCQTECLALQRELAARDKEIAGLRQLLERYDGEQRSLVKLEAEQALRVEELTEELREYRRREELKNRPERVEKDRLQLAFESLIEAKAGAPSSANDNGAEGSTRASEPASASECATTDSAVGANDESGQAARSEESGPAQKPSAKPREPAKGRHNHGRRPAHQWALPECEWRIEPDEVKASPHLYRQFDEEVSYRTAYRAAGYVTLKVIRPKYVLVTQPLCDAQLCDAQPREPAVLSESVPTTEATPAVVVAALPDSLIPRCMAEVSAIAHVIVSKYEDILPLYRQERISKREDFFIPRSTQANWLEFGYQLLQRIVMAMFIDAKSTSTVIGVDATGAPVQRLKACRRAHVFALVSNAGHIVFRWVNEHTSASITAMLHGYHGTVLCDASSIYNCLTREGMVLAYCWAHVRRYFYRAMATDERLAVEAMAIVAKLFVLEREAKAIELPERTAWRRERALPIVTLFERWVDEHYGGTNLSEPMRRALGYCINQRVGLSRFLQDGRIPIHNNSCENELRRLAMGRDVWKYFLNQTGLDWYVTFRSLLASCHLHGLNPQTYLEEVLRLASSWPVHDVLRLSPKYWTETRAQLSLAQQGLLAAPWNSPLVVPATETAVPHSSAPVIVAA